MDIRYLLLILQTPKQISDAERKEIRGTLRLMRENYERRDLVHIMIQEIGVDVTIKRVLWIRARPDYEPLFSILNRMRQDADRRFWIERLKEQENNCDIEADTGQTGTGVKIALQMSHNSLTKEEEYVHNAP